MSTYAQLGDVHTHPGLPDPRALEEYVPEFAQRLDARIVIDFLAARAEELA